MAQRPRRTKPTRRRRRPGSTVRRRRRRYRRLEVEQEERGPALLWLTVFFLGLVGATLYYFGPGSGEEEVEVDDFARQEADGGPDYARLDPSTYRSEISTLETALFDTPGATEGQFAFAGREIANAVTPLQEELAEADNARVPEALSDLRSLAEDAGADGFDFDRLQTLRGRWLDIRESTFDSATWLRRLPTVNADGGSDPAVYAVYLDVSNELLDLVDTALGDAESLTEGESYMDPAELADAREQWGDSVTRWREELADLQRRLPDRPSASGGPDLLSAVQRLESALRSSKSLFASTAAPRSPLNRRPYQDALESTERAIEALDRLDG